MCVLIQTLSLSFVKLCHIRNEVNLIEEGGCNREILNEVWKVRTWCSDWLVQESALQRWFLYKAWTLFHSKWFCIVLNKYLHKHILTTHQFYEKTTTIKQKWKQKNTHNYIDKNIAHVLEIHQKHKQYQFKDCSKQADSQNSSLHTGNKVKIYYVQSCKVIKSQHFQMTC